MSTETSYTREPVCPYCGAKEKDAWEIDFGPGLDGETEHSCGSCDEEYLVYRQVSVNYSTFKIEKVLSDAGSLEK